jgi:hypothetical protein
LVELTPPLAFGLTKPSSFELKLPVGFLVISIVTVHAPGTVVR